MYNGFSLKPKYLQIVIFLIVCMTILPVVVAQDSQTISNEQINVEKIVIDRVKYNTEKINMVMTTFSKFFTNYKNMDILKYAVCKYLLPRYLYTNALQLLSHQLILNLKKKCPECVLGFYKTLEETPVDFQWAAKILSFVPKFADYKLKIQALQTLLHTFNFYAEDIIGIVKENNYQKIIDYVTLIEEELINVYSETYTKWDQNNKECSISFLEDMNFDKCTKSKEIPKIDKGDINCGCDNRTPLTSYEYFNKISHYPLDLIFDINTMYSNHYLDKIKEALSFSYTFKKHLEHNFTTLYKIFYTTIADNDNVVYELCTKTCKEPKDPTKTSLQQNQLIAFCKRMPDEQKCTNSKCIWCNNQCVALPAQCNAFPCKNTSEVSKSIVKKCDTRSSPFALRYIDENKIGVYLSCMNKHFTQQDVLKLCKKFTTVYVCDYAWIHKIGDEEYNKEIKDCYWYDICKCFDKQEIESSGDDIELPRCEPILPR